MSRQPEHDDGIRMEVPDPPPPAQEPEHDVSVGDIFRSQSGQPAYWWVVGLVRGQFHHTAIYLVFNMQGEVIGCSRAGVHYLQRRQKIGHADVPALQPEWY